MKDASGSGTPREPRPHHSGLRARWHDSAVGRLWRHGSDLELLHRAMGFSALGLVTLVPLLIVVAAALPFQERGFALWVIDGMSLSGRPADAVRDLFAAPSTVLSATSVLSGLLVALFGVSFAASVQNGYERIWEVPAGPWHHVWRRVVWLAALTAYLLAETQSGAVLRDGLAQSVLRIVLATLFGVLFFWWGQHFLLGERVAWGALLPGAVVTMAGLGGLRWFSDQVFSPLIVSNAITYGAVGTVLIVQSWLIGVGFVVFGGPLLGRHVHDMWQRRR
ncbi:ribonuclease BN [Streptomyces phyllanthi]|uniref:YihY/virulence factor BrkB family protein n=1 Tax=Streptomyces phyllanthi TaxID=1803180 RepID=A0A5N8WAB9_9ACTN|nr:ribonuclease BN [Streptomyces phyllanthi]MPY44430.1 YihY/virulence factor BrkB family protein [Streptomyces phyllanthi]